MPPDVPRQRDLYLFDSTIFVFRINLTSSSYNNHDTTAICSTSRSQPHVTCEVVISKTNASPLYLLTRWFLFCLLLCIWTHLADIWLPKGRRILIKGGNEGGISVDNMGEEYLWVTDAVGRCVVCVIGDLTRAAACLNLFLI